MTPAIDIHTHIVPAEFPPYAGRHAGARWPEMQAAGCGHRNVMIAGRNFRTVSDACWDVERRLEAMAAMGIDRQALSPMPELLSYWLDPEDALAMARHVNDTIAAMAARAPGHFAALGMVPLQDPELAARELERLMAGGAFRGVEIGTNVNGAPIGDPRFAPFFAAAEATGAAIFVHALHPAPERFVGPAAVHNLVGFPCEVAYAIASLMTGGILERHPGLRIAFSHGGGAFAMILRRLAHGWHTFPAVRDAMKSPPGDHARRLYYDTLVYDRDALAFLIESFGETQLCLGTDYPFDIHDREPLQRLVPLGLDERRTALLRGGNAARFLGEAVG